MLNKKINFSALISRLCAMGVAFLGFGCSSSEEGELICMYGTPTGSWEIRGSVTNQEGKSVAEATVRVTRPELDSDNHPMAEAETDNEGAYSIEDGYFVDRVKVVCVPEDPTLAADSTLVDLKYVKDRNDKNSWYIGHAEATVDFKLKSKSDGKE